VISFDGLIWLLLILGPLVFFQQRLHLEMQAIFLLITRRADLTLVLFSMLFFPGVVLHEGSHFLMARLLMVRTGRFSLLPRPLDGGRVRLGYVETERSDLVRDALIGLAPLIAGGVFVAYAGLARLGLHRLWDNLVLEGPRGLLEQLPGLQSMPDFWLWFYLLFVISSTMLPSASDRRAWLPLSLGVGLLLVLALLAGAGPWMLANLAPTLDRVLRAVAVVLTISLIIHLILLVPFYLLRRMLNRLTGLEVA
jgi:hypothetical protein